MNPLANRAAANRSASSSQALLISLHSLMFLSGALALVYEILWMRRFAAVFGAATPAVAATLAAVFLGLTAGSFVVGASAARWNRPLRAYGLLEIGAGAGALLVEPLLGLYGRVYPELYQALAGSPAAFAAVKTALAMAAIFLPAFCMGGTVPLLGQALAHEERRLGVSAGGLYAANTFGAALGAFSVPFFWLPNLSARASYGACVVGSLLVGLVAWGLDAGSRKPGATPELAPASKKKPFATPGEQPALSLRSMTVLAALSGLLLFILQVAWSRMFAQVHENSIHSFSLVVAVLLVGLAGGAAIARRWLRSGRTALRCLGWAWMSAGALVLVTPNVFFAMTSGLAYIGGGAGWTSYGLKLLWLTVPTVLAPTLLAGTGLPLLMEMAGRTTDQPAGRVLGRLIGVNTAGSIVGALLAAFVLPAWLGMWMTLAGVGVMMTLAGGFCLLLGRTALAPRLALPAVVAAAFFALDPTKLPRAKYRASQGESLLAIRESSHGIIAVVQKGPSRRIKLNNYYVVGGTASTGDERLQAHLPLLLHPAPRRVALLGLGTGITAGAALLHPTERITAVEIVPEVIAAAREYFADANLRVLESPRVEVIGEDARNYLQGAARRFDVIVGDLFVPWHRGEASLYTAEHFAVVRRALAPGGIFCQWLPLFQLSEEEFNIVIATFLDVFPHATLWRGDFAPAEPAVGIVGQVDGVPLDPAVVERRLRELKADEANPALAHPAGLWMLLAGPVDAREKRFARAPRNRENAPWLEILGPLHHAGSPRGGRPLFVGRSLETYLNELRSLPVIGTPLARLDATQLQWRTAGARLADVSILVSEGRIPEADALLRQIVLALPSEIRAAFGAADAAAAGNAQ